MAMRRGGTRHTGRRHGGDSRGASNAAPVCKAGGSSARGERRRRTERRERGGANAGRGLPESARSPHAERAPARRVCRPALDTTPGVSPVLRVASDAAPARGGGEELTPPNRAQGRTDEDKRRAIDTAAAGRLLGCGGESHQTTRSTRACAPAARASPVAMRAGEGSLRATRRPRTRQQ